MATLKMREEKITHPERPDPRVLTGAVTRLDIHFLIRMGRSFARERRFVDYFCSEMFFPLRKYLFNKTKKTSYRKKKL